MPRVEFMESDRNVENGTDMDPSDHSDKDDGRELADTVEMPAIADDDKELARDILHLSAIQAWQALASGRPAPDLDPDLEQAIYEAFATGDSHQVNRLCDDWLDLARHCGLAVEDPDGELWPDVLDAITHTVSAAIWFGLTAGYLTLTGNFTIPRKFLAYEGLAAC